MDQLDFPPAQKGPIELPWPEFFNWREFSEDDGKKRAIYAELQCTFSVFWKKGQNWLSVRGPPEHLHTALQRAMELMRPDMHQQALAGEGSSLHLAAAQQEFYSPGMRPNWPTPPPEAFVEPPPGLRTPPALRALPRDARPP